MPHFLIGLRTSSGGVAALFRRALAAAAVLMATLGTPPLATAEFFSRGLLTWVAPVQTAGVAAVIVAHGAAEGVFVSYLPDGNVQSFDPNNLPPGTASLFLSFNPSLNRFSEVILSNGKRYGIGGSFAVSLGPVMVSLNLQPFSSYLSVVTDNSQSASILGIAGGQAVVNSGGAAVEVLAANSALSERSGIISSYHVQAESGELLLGDAPFTGSQIGVSVESVNHCLGDGATILSAADYERWSKATDKSLEPFKESRILPSSLTILTSTSKFVTVLDAKGTLGVIRDKTNSGQNETTASLCALSPL